FTFVGLQNFKELFSDTIFLRSMNNTLLIVLVSVPIVTVFSLWVGSSLYNMNKVSQAFFRCIFYLPVVTGTVAVTVVWKWMFNQYTGLFNYILNSAGLISQNISWLGDPKTAIWCIITILFTTSIGQPIVLYISALGNVDHAIIEAAHVDGATEMQTFWRIKWQSIMPTTVYIVVITTINSFQCFALIQLLTSGGPMNSTSTIMYYIYYNAFKLFRYGYGNAMGVILAGIIAIFSAIQFKVLQNDH
ncbi:MAG: sugar ABC transporter permease, partial [Clostridia bacterium]